VTIPVVSSTPAVAEPGRFSRHVAARRGEVRLPASLAVLVAGTLHALLPTRVLFEPRWLIPVLEALLLVALTFVNPNRMTTETRVSRVAGIILVSIIIITNTISLIHVLDLLIAAHPQDGRDLLLAAGQVWVTNMIAFALVFWELDRGGAVARGPSSDVQRRRADFLFPQDDERVARIATGSGEELWIPVFVDYLYLSITNSTAFSPTDTMPLTARAKLLMTFEAIAAMVTSLLVVARAVNILT
jgi:hypothetical protein